MGKETNPRRVADNEAMAVCRMLRVSPQKLNLVATQIRGKKVGTALAELTFSKKRIAGDVKKTLQSAIANAENNHGLDVDESRRCRSLGRQEHHAQAGPSACARTLRADPETVRTAHDQGPQVEESALMGQKVNPIGIRLGVNRTWDQPLVREHQGFRRSAARRSWKSAPCHEGRPSRRASAAS